MTWRGSPSMMTASPLPPVRIAATDASGIEALAPLVEHGDFQIGAELHAAGIGSEHAREQIDERGLAGAVRADDADAVAAGDLDAEVAHQGELAIALGDAPCLDHLPAGLSRLLDRELHVSRRAVGESFPALAAKRDQALEPALVALPPGAHTVAEPMLFLHDAPVELMAARPPPPRESHRAKPRRSRSPCRAAA